MDNVGPVAAQNYTSLYLRGSKFCWISSMAKGNLCCVGNLSINKLQSKAKYQIFLIVAQNKDNLCMYLCIYISTLFLFGFIKKLSLSFPFAIDYYIVLLWLCFCNIKVLFLYYFIIVLFMIIFN